MRYVTFQLATPIGPVERIGVVIGDRIIDLNLAYRLALTDRASAPRARAIADAVVPPDLITFLANGAVGKEALTETLETFGAGLTDPSLVTPEGSAVSHAREDVRLLAPIPRPTSLRDCSAYEQHVLATAGPKGPHPLWYEFPTYYKGNPNSVAASGDDLIFPSWATEVDYELEYAVVIGRAGTDIAEADALDHVAGYMLFNDCSVRETQFQEMRMHLGPAKSKDFDGANILGPHLVSPDEWDPNGDHAMVARVNGQEWSRGLTSSIHFSVARIIAHMSRDEGLQVGDVIGTGTVGGGCGLELGRFPQPGDLVELEVEGLGLLRNRWVGARELPSDQGSTLDRPGPALPV